jgi:teichoic acid transport system permease protein
MSLHDAVPGGPAVTRPWTAAEARAAGLRELSRRPGIGEYLRLLWGRREFALLAPLGELRQRNMNTVFGSLWHVMNPLFQAAIYYFLFGVVLDSRGGIENFAVWLIIGLITFGLTQKIVASCSDIIVNRLAMLRTLNFPAGILPISVTLGELIAHGPALLVVLAVALTVATPSSAWLLVIPIVLLQTVMSLGIGLVAARITVHFRDFSQILGHLLKMWLFASGVIFPIDGAPEGWIRDTLQANPAHVFIELTRGALLDGALPDGMLRLAVIYTAVAFVLGAFFFHRYEGRYSSAA